MATIKKIVNLGNINPKTRWCIQVYGLGLIASLILFEKLNLFNINLDKTIFFDWMSFMVIIAIFLIWVSLHTYYR